MNTTTKTMFGVVAALLLVSVAAAYAHTGSMAEMEGNSMEGCMMHKMSDEEMDKMHAEMTADMDPEQKAEMDEMHESCKMHKDGDHMKGGHMGMM